MNADREAALRRWSLPLDKTPRNEQANFARAVARELFAELDAERALRQQAEQERDEAQQQ